MAARGRIPGVRAEAQPRKPTAEVAATGSATATAMGRECDAAAAAAVLRASGTAITAVPATSYDTTAAATAIWRVCSAVHGATTGVPAECTGGTIFLTVRGRFSV